MKIEKHRLGLVVANSQVAHDVGIITHPILKILSVQVDKGEVVMWVEVDDDLLPERFSFTVVEGEHNIWQNTYRHHFATIQVGDKTYHYHSKNEYEHGCATIKEVSVPVQPISRRSVSAADIPYAGHGVTFYYKDADDTERFVRAAPVSFYVEDTGEQCMLAYDHDSTQRLQVFYLSRILEWPIIELGED